MQHQHLHHDTINNTPQTPTSLLPLFYVFGGVIALTILWSALMGIWTPVVVMRTFMGFFFIVFATFKLLDLKGFAEAYATYDLISKKILAYGYFYPFIELWLGINYLFSILPQITDTVTVVVMGISSVGVLLALRSKKPFRCACLGTKLNVPMTTVTLIEDLLMAAMAAYMLIVLY